MTSPAADQPHYTIGAVVKRTGVPADTIRAWERRYNVPLPARTPSGQRVYSEHDIAVILQLRDRDTGAAQAAEALRPAGESTLDTALADAYRHADIPAADARLNALGAAQDPVLLLCSVVGAFVTAPAPGVSPARRRLAREHLRGRLLRLLAAFSPAGEPVAIAGAPEDDLLALATGVMLAREGWGIRVAGSGLNAAEACELANATGSAAVIVSAAEPLAADWAQIAEGGVIVANVGGPAQAGHVVGVPADPRAAASVIARLAHRRLAGS